MSPRFLSALEKLRQALQSFNGRDPVVRPLLERAFADDLERAADALRRIEKEADPALAALAWSFFWIRQNDLAQARNELERIEKSGKSESLWGGLGLLMLGELCLELGEAKTGAAYLRRAERILAPPP